MCPNSIWHIWLTWWQSEESVTVPGFRMGSGDRDTCKLTTASSQFAKWIIIICCTFWELYVKKSVHCTNTYCVKTCRDGGFICPTCSKVSATRESLSKHVAKLLWKNVLDYTENAYFLPSFRSFLNWWPSCSKQGKPSSDPEWMGDCLGVQVAVDNLLYHGDHHLVAGLTLGGRRGRRP